MWKPRRWLLLGAVLWSGLASGAGLRVIYPAYETAYDTRFNDLIELLQTALEKTVPDFGPFELRPSTLKMTEARYLEALKQGRDVNVGWSSTSIDKEHELLPLRIPLRKGILGYRIALIARSHQARIDRVRTLADLRQLTVGQGLGWGDVALYEANGIKVFQARYDNLFKMTSMERFDLFPRGIGEILAEYAHYGPLEPNLAIEKNLLIYYPWPYYFFFNRQDTVLKKRIEAGLRRMIKDGSFDANFRKYNGKAIEAANIKGRRVIRIANDLLPRETPLDDPILWFDPARDLPSD